MRAFRFRLEQLHWRLESNASVFFLSRHFFTFILSGDDKGHHQLALRDKMANKRKQEREGRGRDGCLFLLSMAAVNVGTALAISHSCSRVQASFTRTTARHGETESDIDKERVQCSRFKAKEENTRQSTHLGEEKEEGKFWLRSSFLFRRSKAALG